MTVADRSNSLLDAARKFQNDLLHTFPQRREAILQLVEALASAEKPTSVVELSQEGAFQRTFSNVHKAVDALSASAKVGLVSGKPLNGEGVATDPAGYSHDPQRYADVDPLLFLQQTRQWTSIFAQLLPQETYQNFRSFALDATPNPRHHAKTLKDRTFVHQAGLLGTPVTIGLQASVLVALPEQVEHEAKWTLPLSIERISSKETPCQTAEKQLSELAQLTHMKDALCVIMVDSGYTHMKPQSPHQVVVARSRVDRTGHRPYQGAQKCQRGRPRKYEDLMIRFAEDIPLGDPGGPDEELEHEDTCNGRPVVVLTNRWKNIYVHGQEELVDVVKVEIFPKGNSSRPLFERPLLLIVGGKRRSELMSQQIYKGYFRRFDIEHFFRFQKQKLLFCGYQTPELQRQVNWWWICFMAYWLLYLVRTAVPESNRPWMPKRRINTTASPGEVKRVFGSKIFLDLGSPTTRPLTRGKSKGRAKGTRLVRRQRQKPIKKAAVSLRAA
jgi:hypothetical protein